MKTLIILRHAKAEAATGAQSDHDRELTSRGQRDALRMGQWLQEHELIPHTILSSTAARARETTAQVIQTCQFAGSAVFLNELYLARPETYVAAARQHGEASDRVLLVGHNSGLEDLVQLLTHEHRLLPTAGLAVIELAIGNWEELALGDKFPLLHFSRP